MALRCAAAIWRRDLRHRNPMKFWCAAALDGLQAAMFSALNIFRPLLIEAPGCESGARGRVRGVEMCGPI